MGIIFVAFFVSFISGVIFQYNMYFVCSIIIYILYVLVHIYIYI